MVDKTEKVDKNVKKEVAPQEKKPPQQKKPVQVEEADRPGFKGIIRIAGKDIRGHIKLKKALAYVRGIGPTLSASVANVIKRELNVSPDSEIGFLTDDLIEKVDAIIFNLQNYKIPAYLLNRRGDYLEGVDKHVVMNDLIFANKQDVEKEKRIFSWTGFRHYYGQKVRGQRTRNTGRTGMAVGVLRKSIIGAAAAAAAPGGAPGKPGAAAPAGGAAPAAGATKGPAPAGGAAKAAAPTAAKPTTKPEAKK